jgi:predicted metal-dependent hydrolase
MVDFFKQNRILCEKSIGGIGKVRFVKKRSSKSLQLRVNAFEGITVIMPHRVSYAMATVFLKNNIDWIISQQHKTKTLEKKYFELDAKHPLPEPKIARKMIEERITFLSLKHDIHFQRLAIRRQKTRWGSCSTQNNINLNIHLARLPQYLMDYVILHELAHINHKNHSKQFKDYLDRLLGNISRNVAETELKKFGVLLLGKGQM